MEITTVSAEFGGQTLTIETGRMARLAGGAVTVRYGDTVVLGTANRSDPRPGLDFFPLTIEFEERMYAAGKIPGGYIKREGKASENATLSARLTDRPIRPLFPEGYKDDVQVVITVLSADQENDPDILGTIAASAALTISEIPFLGPIGAVRVGLVNDKFILNPTFEQLETSDLDLVVSGTVDAIMMVEAGANLINEAKMAEAIEFGHDAIKALISLQEQLRAKVGKAKRVPYIEPGVESVLTFAEAAANGGTFVVVDTETTGLDSKLSDLVEVAAVKIKGGKITDRWSTLVNAGNPIVGAQMHGITTADLKKGIAPKEAAEKLADFAKGAILVGHNLGFDVSFLDEALGKGRSFATEQGQYLDTFVLFREAYPESESFKLGDLARTYGAATAPTHRAGTDAEATAELLLFLAAELPERLATLKEGISDSIRAARSGKGEPKALLEAARRKARLGKNLFAYMHKKTGRALTMKEGIRIDGRKVDQIRPITVEVGLLPRAHGTGLFTRGDTQALSIATLGPIAQAQRLDTISPVATKRYLHHYNMPPYSTGENKPMRGPGRREIGHGALAERALLPVLPSAEEFPYTIRVVSECVTSNGSTSMASTCGSSLALLDAGVPIKAAVAGAAMGLMSEPGGEFVVLTDILGKEDAFGDMDFKVTGTREGISALQMDIKVQGITGAIIRTGLKDALAARLEILDKMDAVISTARPELSDFAPRITTIKINPEKIRDIIGKGGAVIRKLQDDFQVNINVEDDGTVQIASNDPERTKRALDAINGITKEVEVGTLYMGKVTRIMGFGCFVEILPGKEGLVRIGELADYRVNSVEDEVAVGDEIMVVVMEVDRQGRVNLSRRAAMQRHKAAPRE
jgi:polyribonucleotide nucleotidyltransferase